MREFFIGDTDLLSNLDQGNISADMIVSAVKAGGRAFLDESGKNVFVAWRTLGGGYVCLQKDLTYLSSQTEIFPRLVSLDVVNLLEPPQPLTHEDIIYRFVLESDFDKVDEIMSKTFTLDGPNHDLYRLMFGGGGHVGGIFDANDHLVGFTTVIAMYNDLTQQLGFLLDMIGVDPTLQSRGIGKFAVRSLALVAQSYGVNNIEVTYDPTDSRLAHFYNGLGFQINYFHPNLYGNNSDRFAASLDLNNKRRNEFLQQESIQSVPITEVVSSGVAEKINNGEINIIGVQGSNYIFKKPLFP